MPLPGPPSPTGVRRRFSGSVTMPAPARRRLSGSVATPPPAPTPAPAPSSSRRRMVPLPRPQAPEGSSRRRLMPLPNPPASAGGRRRLSPTPAGTPAPTTAPTRAPTPAPTAAPAPSSRRRSVATGSGRRRLPKTGRRRSVPSTGLRRRRFSAPPAPSATPAPAPVGNFSIPAGAAAADAFPSPGLMRDVFDRHNLYRCVHGVPLMTWHGGLVGSAEASALRADGKVQPSPLQSRVGIQGFTKVEENLGGGVTSAQVVDAWYNDVKLKLQIVSSDSTSIGCGVYKQVLVCHYGPGGNGANAMTPQKSVKACAFALHLEGGSPP